MLTPSRTLPNPKKTAQVGEACERRKKTALRGAEGSLRIQLSLGRFSCLGKHILEQDFEGHRVAATLMSKEELTVTGESTLIKLNAVFVVISVKSQVKLVEVEPFWIFCVSLGLFPFADHSVVHFQFSFVESK
jgi:hypothetical protein